MSRCAPYGGRGVVGYFNWLSLDAGDKFAENTVLLVFYLLFLLHWWPNFLFFIFLFFPQFMFWSFSCMLPMCYRGASFFNVLLYKLLSEKKGHKRRLNVMAS